MAVHYPLDYSQAMNDKFALRQRMVRYLMPVFFLSLLFNITKFFEAKYFYGELGLHHLSLGSCHSITYFESETVHAVQASSQFMP